MIILQHRYKPFRDMRITHWARIGFGGVEGFQLARVLLVRDALGRWKPRERLGLPAFPLGLYGLCCCAIRVHWGSVALARLMDRLNDGEAELANEI